MVVPNQVAQQSSVNVGIENDVISHGYTFQWYSNEWEIASAR